MKKTYILLILLLSILLSSCIQSKDENISILTPNGIPLIAISNYLVENTNITYETSAGSDSLISGFVNSLYDVIIAPTNLGIKMYNNNHNYLLFRTLCWGNLYLCSTEKINSLTELNNNTIVAFGENNTPGIVIKALINYYKIDCNIEFYNDISSVNPLFLSNKVDIIISSEPQVSILGTKKNFYTLDLIEIYKNVYGDIPQSSIFIRKDLINNKTKMSQLQSLINSINEINTNENTVKNIKSIESNFNNYDDSLLKNAIVKCNIYTKENEQDSIYNYLNILDSLNMKNLYGGNIPDDTFFVE